MGFINSLLNINWKNFNIADVIQGCAASYLVDYYSEDKKEKLQQVIEYRMNVCHTCHMNDDNFCQNNGTKTIKNAETGEDVIGCGCNLKCKTALLSSECPAKLWKAVV